jgi:hypothetical protein
MMREVVWLVEYCVQLEIDTQARFNGHFLRWIFHLPDFHFFFRHLYDALHHRDVSNPCYLLVKSLASFMVHDTYNWRRQHHFSFLSTWCCFLSHVEEEEFHCDNCSLLLNSQLKTHILSLVMIFFEKSLLVSVQSSKLEATDKWLSFWPCVNIYDMNYSYSYSYSFICIHICHWYKTL